MALKDIKKFQTEKSTHFRHNRFYSTVGCYFFELSQNYTKFVYCHFNLMTLVNSLYHFLVYAQLQLNQHNHRLDRTHIGNTYTVIMKRNNLFRWKQIIRMIRNMSKRVLTVVNG